jgi:hypothetical protein
MKALLRKLQKLEAGLAPPAGVSHIAAVPVQTGGDDLMLIDGEWVPCPNVTAVLEQPGVPVMVCIGFDPREIFT